MCVARSLFLYVACLSVRYSGTRCIARSFALSRVSISSCTGYCIARSFSFVARLPLLAALAIVYYPLSFSVAHLSYLLNTLATGALLALFRSVARLPLLATPALVLPALSFSTSRVSPLGTPAPGALPAPSFSTSHVYRCSGYRCVTGFFGRVGFF